MKPLRAGLLTLAAITVLSALAPSPAPPQTRLKMVLNWKYQGPQGWFFPADDRGYFKAAGVDVVTGCPAGRPRPTSSRQTSCRLLPNSRTNCSDPAKHVTTETETTQGSSCI